MHCEQKQPPSPIPPSRSPMSLIYLRFIFEICKDFKVELLTFNFYKILFSQNNIYLERIFAIFKYEINHSVSPQLHQPYLRL